MRIAAFLLIMLLAAIPAASHFIAHFYYLPVLNAPHMRLAGLTPKILNDLKVLEQRTPFVETRYQRDAQAYLARYIFWEGSSDVATQSDRVRELLTRYLYWKAAPGELKQLLNDPDFKALDTSWMEQLLKFDHWNLTSNTKMRELMNGVAERDGFGRIAAFATLPLPNYNELRLWATLNMLKQQKAGHIAKAFVVFRKAAQLCHSTGTLVGSMMAVAMLKDEQALKDVFKVKEWEVVPPPVIDAYQRVSWAWVGISREPWFGEFPETFKPYFRPEFGACTAAWEFTAGPVGYQDFLEPRAPFETDFTANFERARTFQEQLLKICNMSEFTAAWSKTPAHALASAKLEWGRVPYLRRILGLSLMSVAIPNYWQMYERHAAR